MKTIKKQIFNSQSHEIDAHLLTLTTEELIDCVIKDSKKLKYIINYLNHKEQHYLLLYYIRSNKLKEIKCLTEHGVDIEADNGVALHEAITNEHIEIVHYLVEQGVNIEAKNGEALYIAVFLATIE